VKRFIRNLREDFDQELSVHLEINHNSVVRLIGYCIDEDALMMVTEYIVDGNLCDIFPP
jgi:serine/threonine protein kinase